VPDKKGYLKADNCFSGTQSAPRRATCHKFADHTGPYGPRASLPPYVSAAPRTNSAAGKPKLAERPFGALAADMPASNRAYHGAR
jgi:hypothetical protein